MANENIELTKFIFILQKHKSIWQSKNPKSNIISIIFKHATIVITDNAIKHLFNVNIHSV